MTKSPLSPLISLSWSKSKSIVSERDPEQTVKPQTFHIPDSRTNLRDACDVLTEEEQSPRTTMAWRRAFEASTAVSDFDSLRWSFTDRQTRLRHSIPDSCSSICLSTCSTLSLFEFSWKLIVKWKLFEIESFENHLNQNEYASIFNIRSKTFESWFESFENYFLLIALCFQKIIVNVISVYQFMKK